MLPAMTTRKKQHNTTNCTYPKRSICDCAILQQMRLSKVLSPRLLHTSTLPGHSGMPSPHDPMFKVSVSQHAPRVSGVAWACCPNHSAGLAPRMGMASFKGSLVGPPMAAKDHRGRRAQPVTHKVTRLTSNYMRRMWTLKIAMVVRSPELQ